jgi:putative transposase
MRKHREIEGEIKFVTISRNKCGQYFVSITVERNISRLPKTENLVGIDLGIKSLAICSDGKTYENIRAYKKLRHKLKKAQRSHSKKKKGSKNRERARIKLARVHQKIKNIRENHLHQITRQIINENQVIILENLNISGMLKNHCLAQAIADVSLSEFNKQLEYKAKWYGRTIHRLSRWFPSSKTCSECGWINQGLTLKNREWTCNSCGIHHDRDMNAAINIERQGRQELKIPMECRESKRMDSEKKLVEHSIG